MYNGAVVIKEAIKSPKQRCICKTIIVRYESNILYGLGLLLRSAVLCVAESGKYGFNVNKCTYFVWCNT